MTFVIAGTCIADYSCVEACPVGCIHPTPDEPEYGTAEQLYIDPATCIDCAACTEACPVDAVYDGQALPDLWSDYARVNAEHFESPSRSK
jgi:NAD-dependent dihydropyrimidine dehydrogenase PreA subunit